MRRVHGVLGAEANPLTRNILIRFDPAAADEQTVVVTVRELEAEVVDAAPEDETELPPAQRERRGGAGTTGRARIAVRGLDRDPQLTRLVVERLERWPTVRASASQLTGRVLVEFDESTVRLEDLTSEVADLEAPGLQHEGRPNHPLDPEPLAQSATRTAGAALGLGLLASRRMLGRTGPPSIGSGPAVAAGVISVLDGFPATRNGLRRIVGPNAADLTFNAANIALLTLSGGTLGLAVGGAAALRLLTEVQARRTSWRRYEESLESSAPARQGAIPGATIRLESGQRTPLPARVLEGTGTGVGADGLPEPVIPGGTVSSGSRLHGGPFALELREGPAFTPKPRPAPAAATLYDRYVRTAGPLSLAYAGATALLTRSLTRTLAALLLVNPRAGVLGAEAAGTGASARVLRSGVTVVGTRPERGVRLPDALLLDGPRTLTDGLEVSSALPLSDTHDASGLLARAAGVSAAAGSPWGRVFPTEGSASASEGAFDGKAATAYIEETRYSLGLVEEGDPVSAEARFQTRGGYLLVLRSDDGGPEGLLALRPRLAAGVAELVGACRRHGVEIGVLSGGDPAAAQEVARRAEVELLARDGHEGSAETIRSRQQQGQVVAFASDNAHAASAFDACDLALGITEGGPLPARADLLAPDLGALAAVIEAGALREAAVRDSVALSAVSTVTGALWGALGRPGVVYAPYPASLAALGALASGWARLRGGERPRSSVSHVADPRPERWGRRSVQSTLRALDTGEAGLTSAQAAQRRQEAPPRAARRNRLVNGILDQLRSPLTGVLAAGAGLSLLLDSTADVAMIGTMIVANAGAGAWQERQADKTAEALEALWTAYASVLRDGSPVTVPATEVVPGDVLILAPGDRITADARLIDASGLEVDEAALTGESVPVPKSPDEGIDTSRIVLEGSDVTVGAGRAVVVATGRDTRMGAIAAALAVDDPQQSPLTTRLERMLRQALPLIAAGGAIVFASGVLRGRPPLPQLALGASVAIAAVVGGRLYVEGAAEALVHRCGGVRFGDEERPLDEAGRRELLARTRSLAERGLRVLMVAEGSSDIPLDDPRGLVALGFLGISDPLRPAVPGAVQRCHEAGVRVVMLTGDHPATATAIARDAGLLDDGHKLLTGSEIAELDDTELDRRLQEATVIARVTPLDKLRIVESLQRSGHTVAMTGDGVNDAPALRLADAGVAMGRGGTEVARQTADVVLADDDFSTLVEALVEGRSFWRNIRRALGLLLGGNLGELGLMAGASVLSTASPLISVQVLAMNLITDVLPALAVALQQPEHRNLSGLNREGASALESSLRNDVLRRGVATAAPSLAAYMIALRSSSLPQARAVAYASIVVTQLAQTLDVGRAEGGLSRSVAGAVAGSAVLLGATFAVSPLRTFLNLTLPTPLGWTLVGAGTLAAVLLGRLRSHPTLFATPTAEPAMG
ncbi:MAG: HAD-IC family P-type ATPase [Actinomycetota bacterium]|nr:HAD-IC family P-type ATPase [Actinomycetota bacterium]